MAVASSAVAVCGKMRLFDRGVFTTAEATSSSPRTGDRRADRDSRDAHLRLLLRRAAKLRDTPDLQAQNERRRIWQEIVGAEHYAIREQVKLRGIRQTGSRWVNDGDVDDVTQNAIVRATRMFERLRGVSPGELHAAIKTCVRYAVADYVRDDQNRSERPVDPHVFEPGTNHDGHGLAAVGTLCASSSAEDRAMFKQRIEGITALPERGATVIMMRTAGYSSKEIASELGLSAANVDQIYSRSMKTLIEVSEDG